MNTFNSQLFTNQSGAKLRKTENAQLSIDNLLIIMKNAHSFKKVSTSLELGKDYANATLDVYMPFNTTMFVLNTNSRVSKIHVLNEDIWSRTFEDRVGNNVTLIMTRWEHLRTIESMDISIIDEVDSSEKIITLHDTDLIAAEYLILYGQYSVTLDIKDLVESGEKLTLDDVALRASDENIIIKSIAMNYNKLLVDFSTTSIQVPSVIGMHISRVRQRSEFSTWVVDISPDIRVHTMKDRFESNGPKMIIPVSLGENSSIPASFVVNKIALSYDKTTYIDIQVDNFNVQDAHLFSLYINKPNIKSVRFEKVSIASDNIRFKVVYLTDEIKENPSVFENTKIFIKNNFTNDNGAFVKVVVK